MGDAFMNAAITVTEMRIPGCLQLHFPAYADRRGSFVKVYRRSDFAESALEVEFAESFHTVSGERVLRGMHLQLPPAHHSKLVYCVAGRVLDVVLDLRRGSPAFGSHAAIELSPEGNSGLYLPHGVAHGFYVLQAPSIMAYHVTSEHAAALDAGVRWNSFGAPWPDNDPVMSTRDAALPPLCDFDSPFEFRPLAEAPG